MCHILYGYIETTNSFIKPRVVLYWPAMTVSDTRWHLMSSYVFLINAVFCWHNIAGINGPKVSFTDRAAVVITDLRSRSLIRWWQLLFRDVIYQSTVLFINLRVPFTDPWKKRNGQNRPKKRSPKPNLFCTFILVHWPNFLRKKNSHFTIALDQSIYPYIEQMLTLKIMCAHKKVSLLFLETL